MEAEARELTNRRDTSFTTYRDPVKKTLVQATTSQFPTPWNSNQEKVQNELKGTF